MRIEGKGIEISIGLTPHEIFLLLGASLFGKAKIWDYNDGPPSSVKIGVSLYPEPFMVEEIRTNGLYVGTIPKNAYFPQASQILFHLGEDMGDEILSKGYSCRRFGSGGKIKLYDITRKMEVYQ